MRQVTLDTETTGREIRQGHRILEIGCIELVDRQLTGRYFHRYLNPGKASEPEAFAVHGLSTEFLQNKPTFDTIVDELLLFLQGSELIIHNAPFDLAFLDQELSLVNRQAKKLKLDKKYQKIRDYCPKIIDTLPLARQLYPGQRNNLDALCKRLNVDNTQRHKHGALLDARLSALVYLAMTEGQMCLFSEEKTPSSLPGHTPNSKKIKISLPVIQATEKELLAHKQILAMIGKHRWPLETEEPK